MIAFRKLGEMGRLGNSLFQIAATIGIAKANGMDYGFNKWDYEGYFKIELPKAPLGDMSPLREQDFGFSSYEVSPELDYELMGYFQSEKYWEHIKDEIIDGFDRVRAIPPLLQIHDIISVHVRRGDYLKLSNYHTNLTLDYYKRAMAMFPGSPFFVFSDDIGWCERNIKGNGVSYIPSTVGEVESLKLMSQCSHNIIANSSFSWWGAYLNRNPDKIVIAPKQWFGKDGPQNTQDLIPKSWVTI